MSALPAGWAATSIANIALFNPKTVAEDSLNAAFAPMQFLGTRYRDRMGFEVRAWGEIKRAYVHFQPNDVIVAKVTPCFENGKAGIAPPLPNGIGAGSSEFCVFRPAQGIDERYLLAWLSTEDFRRRATLAMTGSVGLKRVPKETFLSEQILLAPVAEQKRIADKLDTLLTRVDAVNARLARVAPILKRFRQSVLAAAMAGKLTSDWREANEAEDPSQVPIQTNEDAGTWSFSSLPASWSVCGFDSCFSDETDSARKVPQANYIMNGTLAVVDQGLSLIGGYTNDVAMISMCRLPVLVFGDHTRIVKWIDFPFAQGADGVKVLKPRLKAPKFAYLLLRAITLPAKGYSRHYKYLKRSVFPLPPNEEQAEIVRRVETLFAFADRLEARLQTAQTATERLTPALLAKAFRGELVPQDPNDEPASELLKRLAAANTAPATPKRRGRAPRAA